jgi:succinate dehydrogenase / fumarate reductase cytochrome b subunit
MSDHGFETPLPGADERARRGPVPHKGPGPAVTSWVEPRGRALGGRAFTLHRLTGAALVLYLYVHLGVLTLLWGGASSWRHFISVASSTVFLGFDVVLVFLLLFHALNGVRVGLIGSGMLVARERLILRIAMAVGALALAYAAFHILGEA